MKVGPPAFTDPTYGRRNRIFAVAAGILLAPVLVAAWILGGVVAVAVVVGLVLLLYLGAGFGGYAAHSGAHSVAVDPRLQMHDPHPRDDEGRGR